MKYFIVSDIHGSLYYTKKIQELIHEKMAENEESLSVRAQIDNEVQELRKLKKKRDRIKRDYDTAVELGLSALEYKKLLLFLKNSGTSLLLI